jgi:hypothetical protein
LVGQNLATSSIGIRRYTYLNIVPSLFISDCQIDFGHSFPEQQGVSHGNDEGMAHSVVAEESHQLDWSVMAQSSHHRGAAFFLRIERPLDPSVSASLSPSTSHSKALPTLMVSRKMTTYPIVVSWQKSLYIRHCAKVWQQ